MNRFPVGRAIAHAYGFLVRRILTVIALSWVAAALYAALRFALFRTEPLLWPMEHPEIAAFHLAGMLASLLLLSAIAISLTRAALGEHREWTFAHLVIGARELRLFGAMIVLVVLIVVAIAASVAAVVGAGRGIEAALTQWPAIGQTGLPVAHIAHIAVAVLVSVVATYVVLRLSFLLFPVAAVEDRASLAGAWQLGRGNVVRMFVVTLAIIVPVYAVFAAVEYALLGGALTDAVRTVFSAGAHDPAPFMALLANHAEAISIGSAIMLVVMTALNAGASSSAYAALTGRVVAEAVVPVAAPAPHEAEGHDEYAHAAPDGNEEHGHNDHGQDSHDHEDHGHEAHEAHGHEPHADDAHDHDDHAEQAHADEPHGHADHDHDAHAVEVDHTAGHGHDEHGHDAHGDDAHADGEHSPTAHADHGHEEAAHDEPGHEPHVHAAPEEPVHDEHADAEPVSEGQGHDEHGLAAPEDDSHRHATEPLELTEEVAGETVPEQDEAAEGRVLEHA